MNIENPCVTCGACCAYYRVSFHWMECCPEHLTGPSLSHTVRRDHHQVCMAGTLSKPARCIELCGELGVSIGCAIYERRASPCRNFGVQMQSEGGWTISEPHLLHCNEARAHHNLPALVPARPPHQAIPGTDETPLPHKAA